MLQQYWEQHPFQYEVIQILREGQWVSHVFEWIFMMISRFTGYLMTLAIGYLIYYAIEYKHALDAIPAHPQFPDQLASISNMVINVGPELVFPGIVVLCIRAFTVRRWLDGTLYLITSIAFVVLTMVLLNAFMNDGINKDFLAAMLFWRAGAALTYTVVVAYCGGHGGLDFRSLLNELDTLREQLESGQQTVSTLQEQLSTAQQRASSLQQQVDTGRQEVSTLKRQLDTQQQRASTLQQEVETGHGDTAGLRRELSTALAEAETLRTQLTGKQREVEGLREQLQSGQEWQESRFQKLLTAEQQRASSLQEQLTNEQNETVALRRQLNTAQLDTENLQAQLKAKQQEVERVQAALNTEQQAVSTLRQQLDTEQQRVSSKHSVQVSSEQTKVDRGKVVQLDSRSRKSGQDENAIAEQVRALLSAEPDLSGRAIAARLNISPTTANRWKGIIENDGQSSEECVNE